MRMASRKRSFSTSMKPLRRRACPHHATANVSWHSAEELEAKVHTAEIIASRKPRAANRKPQTPRLAQELGSAVDLVLFDAAAKSVEAVRTGQADIGFFAIDPLRSDGVRFSAPYVQIEGAYLVRDESPLVDNGQVDRVGTRAMVGKGSACDPHLTRELKNAAVLRAAASPTVVDRFLSENVDVAAGVKQQLQPDAARRPGLRLLPGRST